MIEAPDGSFRLPLADGLMAFEPAQTDLQASAAQLRFHHNQIFKGPPSLLD